MVHLVKMQFGTKLENVLIFSMKIHDCCVKMLTWKFTAGYKCFNTFRLLPTLVHSIFVSDEFLQFFFLAPSHTNLFLSNENPFCFSYNQRSTVWNINKINWICLKRKTSLMIAYIAVYSVITSFICCTFHTSPFKIYFKKWKMYKFTNFICTLTIVFEAI